VVDAVPSAVEVDSRGARWLNASSGDVLGLAADARVREAFHAAVRKLGLHAAPPSQLQQELETRLASFLGRPAALVAADLHAVLRCLPTWRCAIDDRSRDLADDATSVVSADEAQVLLAKGEVTGVIVEALHPQEGDLAPLPRYAEICERFRASLIVHDPCGLGVLGPTGAGTVEHLAVQEQVTLQLSTLGGALPGSGVVVSGDLELISVLRGQLQAPLSAQLAATSRALEISQSEPQRRARLFDVAQQLLEGLRGLGFDTGPCVTPWVPLWLGDQALCQQWLFALAEASVATRAWVAPGASRLLLCLPATATDAQVGAVLDAFARVARKLRVPEPPAHVRTADVVIARPGTWSLAAPCGANWLAANALHRPEEEQQAREQPPLKERLYDAVETLTWRASNASGRSIRRTAGAVRALFDRRRKP
jgi:7-keto-8-aminopelargonate synthetase-like enzyme